MRTITKYVADDGSEFGTVVECVAYDGLCSEISEIKSHLPPVKIRGEGFVQLCPADVLTVQKRLVEIYERLYPSMADRHTEWVKNTVEPAGLSIVCRYISDCSCQPLQRAWDRLTRIDSKFREYEQPFYAIRADREKKEDDC